MLLSVSRLVNDQAGLIWINQAHQAAYSIKPNWSRGIKQPIKPAYTQLDCLAWLAKAYAWGCQVCCSSDLTIIFWCWGQQPIYKKILNNAVFTCTYINLMIELSLPRFEQTKNNHCSYWTHGAKHKKTLFGQSRASYRRPSSYRYNGFYIPLLRFPGVVELIIGLILLYIYMVLRLLLQVKVDVVNNEKTRCFNYAIVQPQHSIYSILRCGLYKQATAS